MKGGKVYGKWPGLGPEQLNEGRDLTLTTDFRSVLGEIISRHLGTKDLNAVFPGFDNDPRKFPNLLKPNRIRRGITRCADSREPAPKCSARMPAEMPARILLSGGCASQAAG